MRKANAPTTLSDKVEKLRLKNIVLILARSPASIKSTYCTGRSSDLFRLSRLPSFHQWQRERQTKFRSSEWNSQQQALFGIYTRFPFHFSRRSVTQSSVCNDKDRKKFLDCTLWCNYFLRRSRLEELRSSAIVKRLSDVFNAQRALNRTFVTTTIGRSYTFINEMKAIFSLSGFTI
jgi:hypothetical protein